jgi:hypothetical protein
MTMSDGFLVMFDTGMATTYPVPNLLDRVRTVYRIISLSLVSKAICTTVQYSNREVSSESAANLYIRTRNRGKLPAIIPLRQASRRQVPAAMYMSDGYGYSTIYRTTTYVVTLEYGIRLLTVYYTYGISISMAMVSLQSRLIFILGVPH